MSWNDHDHRGEYADARHDHRFEYAEDRHRHYDLETAGETAQRDIRSLRAAVRELRAGLDDALGRIRELEAAHQANDTKEGKSR